MVLGASMFATQPSLHRNLGAPAYILAVLAALGSAAQARVTRIVVENKLSPAFEGASFGTAGQYESLAGRAYGERSIPTIPRTR
jgi:hypothetical protein